jgi:thymidine kinase
MEFVAHPGRGWIEAICGSMFSGKTEELVRRLRRATIARQVVQAFKPMMDDRYHPTRICTHVEALWFDAEAVPDVAGIEARLRPDVQVVGIDETQFFGAGIVDLATRLADQGKRVIVAGLDQDFRGDAFEPMPRLLSVAEQITKCMAICVVCGQSAGRSQRLGEDESRIKVGTASAYEARCRVCHRPTPQPPTQRGDGGEEETGGTGA